eukprot:COSAG06_NODE_5778_length_3278_cov_2.766279_3_plen_71_part_00
MAKETARAAPGVQSTGEWRCARMDERMCTLRVPFSFPLHLLLCLCHPLRRLLQRLRSPSALCDHTTRVCL